MMNSKCTKNWRSFVHIFFLFSNQSANQLQPISRSSSISLHFLYKHVITTIFCSASFFKSLIRHVGGLKIGSGHNSIILQESIRHVGGLKNGSRHNWISPCSIGAKKYLGTTNHYCGTTLKLCKFLQFLSDSHQARNLVHKKKLFQKYDRSRIESCFQQQIL
jgi:hypothetical protein